MRWGSWRGVGLLWRVIGLFVWVLVGVELLVGGHRLDQSVIVELHALAEEDEVEYPEISHTLQKNGGAVHP